MYHTAAISIDYLVALFTTQSPRPLQKTVKCVLSKHYHDLVLNHSKIHLQMPAGSIYPMENENGTNTTTNSTVGRLCGRK